MFPFISGKVVVLFNLDNSYILFLLNHEDTGDIQPIAILPFIQEDLIVYFVLAFKEYANTAENLRNQKSELLISWILIKISLNTKQIDRANATTK